MIDITIAEEIKQAVPDTAFGVVSAPVTVTAHDPALWEEISRITTHISSELVLEQLSGQPEVQALRKAYRAVGKDPTRYRGSAEALLRRVLQGKPLYQVNTAVDINNLVSIETMRSIGMFDADKIEPPAVFRIGRPDEIYEGIGRGKINIAGLPVFADRQGPFGSPTSDSERTKITEQTTRLLMVIISFSGLASLDEQTARAVDLFCKYCNSDSEEIEQIIIQ